MSGILYLRCIYGGNSAIVELESDTLKHKNMSLDFYRGGNYVTAGICGFVIEKKSKESIFIALYEREQKMFLCVEENEYDLFDEGYSISVKRKVFNNSVTLTHCSYIALHLSYKTMAGVDDIFGYVESVLGNKPRKIVRQKEERT